MTADVQVAALLHALRRRILENQLSPKTTTYGPSRELTQPAMS